MYGRVVKLDQLDIVECPADKAAAFQAGWQQKLE
jgi:hypothetical protein